MATTKTRCSEMEKGVRFHMAYTQPSTQRQPLRKIRSANAALRGQRSTCWRLYTSAVTQRKLRGCQQQQHHAGARPMNRAVSSLNDCQQHCSLLCSPAALCFARDYSLYLGSLSPTYAVQHSRNFTARTGLILDRQKA